MSSLRKNMEATAQAVLDGFGVWQVDAVMKYRADDCIHQTLPRSIGSPPRNNEEYRKYFASIESLVDGMTFDVDQRVFDTENRKAVIHCWGTSATPIGPYNNEYSMFMTFNEDGTKVVRMSEMLDSAYSKEFFAKLMEHAKTSGGEGRAAVETAFRETGSGK